MALNLLTGRCIDLAHKNVLITGASNGIGRETAKLFASKGFNVFANYNTDEKNALSLSEEFNNIKIIKADISDKRNVDDMFSQINSCCNGIDILINNAGIAQQKLFTDISEEEWDKMFNVNIKGMFLCCKAVVPDMIKNHYGKIVNISSIWGISGASCEVHYSASKSAVIGFTKALASELAPSGINVNCIAPGVIETKMNNNLDEEAVNLLKDEIPCGTFGSPLDIANAIYFFCDDKSSYCYGQVLSPNGGLVL